MKLELGAPIVVSSGPVGLKDWGPWQFPSIERLADGRLHATFHREADSAKAYGLPVGHALSADNGATWQELDDVPSGSGMALPNGDRLRAAALRSRPAAGLSLPPSIGSCKGSYGGTYDFFRLADLPSDLRDGWHFARVAAGQTEWRDERAIVHLPGETRYITEGVFTFPWMWRMRLAPDGSLWGLYYCWRSPEKPWHPKVNCILLRSTNHGHTWDMQSEIAYQGDPAADPKWDVWDGFGEPNVGFLPDGSMICLLRTTEGHGIGPLYSAYSHDNGKTWTAPRVFDDRGVWPAIVELKNGVTLASYGRLGLFVRATSDPTGRVWADKIAVVEPRAYQTDTCSYSDMIVLDDRTALIIYSNFQWPNADGIPCKTIMVRTITATP
jgi:hypothetical protein